LGVEKGEGIPKTGNEGEIEVKDILQPLDGGGRLVCEDLDEVGAGLVAGRLEGVVVELLDAVLDAVVDLGAREGAVDAGRGLCRVAAKEALLVKDDDVAAGEVDGVGGAQAGDWRGALSAHGLIYM